MSKKTGWHYYAAIRASEKGVNGAAETVDRTRN
jgi:hypothetical protein